MKIITQRDLIRGVAQLWNNRYGDYRYDNGEKKAIGVALAALDGDTATAGEVNEIIGNKSWTTMKCDECGRYGDEVIQVGEEPDYESNTANLCRDCVDNIFHRTNHFRT